MKRIGYLRGCQLSQAAQHQYLHQFPRINKKLGNTAKALQDYIICCWAVPSYLMFSGCLCVTVIWHTFCFRLSNHCGQCNYPITIHSQNTAVNSMNHMDRGNPSWRLDRYGISVNQIAQGRKKWLHPKWNQMFVAAVLFGNVCVITAYIFNIV